MTETTTASPLAASPALAQICVPDLAAGAAWYQDVLGLQGQQMTPNAWVFQSGDTMFTVFGDPNRKPNGNTRVAWPVADIRSTVAWLNDRGVEMGRYDPPYTVDDDGVFSASPTGPWAAWFDDPWGNNLQLFQPAQE